MAMAQCPDTLAAAAAAGVTVECCLSGNIKPWMEGEEADWPIIITIII